MDNKTENSNTDAGVGYIKGRPRMGEGNVKIEKEKVDNMTVQQPIGEIAENAGEEQSQSDATPRAMRVRAQKEKTNDNKCDARKSDKETVVVGEGTKGRTGIGDMNDREEIGQEHARLGRINQTQNKMLRELIEQVERQSKEEKNSHGSWSITAAQRSQRSG
jgi:hypothetical protein